MILLLKLLLAPGLVVGATLGTRRWGETVGGVLGGLPVVVGPILVILALDHGAHFAADAAAGALVGLVSLSVFALVFASAGKRLPWGAALGLAWTAVAFCTLILDRFAVSPVVGLALALAALVGVRGLLSASAETAARVVLPTWDLALRAMVTAGLVVGITAASAPLGSRLSGLLASVPILATVLAVFTHARHGPAAAVRLLRGLLLGCVSFALFCFTMAGALGELGLAAGLALATVVAVAVHAALLLLLARGQAVPAPDRRSAAVQ